MALLDWFRSRKDKSNPSDAKPLTPREIQELHAKLHPETHQDFTWTKKEVLRDPRIPKPDLLRTHNEIAESFAKHGNTQSTSLIFSKLPKELRVKIWTLALQDNRFILHVQSNRLTQPTRTTLGWKPPRRALSLARASRATYLETLLIVYSSSIFCIGFCANATYQPLTLLHSLLPPLYIERLAHFELGWHTVLGTSQYYDSHPQAWDLSLLAAEPVRLSSRLWGDVCEVLAGLPNLQSLVVVIWASGTERARLGEHEEVFLGPLERFKGIGRLRVTFPWGEQGSVVWREGKSLIDRRYRDDRVHEVHVPLLDWDPKELRV